MKTTHILMCTIILVLMYEKVYCNVDDVFHNMGDFVVRSWQSMVDFITMDEKLYQPHTKKIRKRKKRKRTTPYISNKFIRIIPRTTSLYPKSTTSTTTTEPNEQKLQAVLQIPYLGVPSVGSIDDWVEVENLHRMPPFAMRRWSYKKGPQPSQIPTTTTALPARPSNPDPRRMLKIPHLKTRPEWNMDDWKSEYGERPVYDKLRETLLLDRPADLYL